MDFLTNLIRHSLTAGAAFLVTKGYIDASMANEIVGAVMVFVSVGWSIYEKKKAGPVDKMEG